MAAQCRGRHRAARADALGGRRPSRLTGGTSDDDERAMIPELSRAGVRYRARAAAPESERQSRRQTGEEAAWRNDVDARAAIDDEKVLVAGHDDGCPGRCQHDVFVCVS